MKTILVLLIAFSAFSLRAQSDFKVVQLKLPKNAVYSASQVEPSIAISPTNQKVMIAGSVLSDYYYSKNGREIMEESYTRESVWCIWRSCIDF